MSLDETDYAKLSTKVPGDVKVGGIVRLFKCLPGKKDWEPSFVEGIICLSFEPDIGYLLVTLTDLSISSILFQQEVYCNFRVRRLAKRFLAFEGDDYVVGLAFGRGADEKKFLAKVESHAPRSTQKKKIQKWVEKERRRIKRKKLRNKIRGKQRKEELESDEKLTISAPTGFQHTAHMGMEEESVCVDGLQNEEWRVFVKNVTGLEDADLSDPRVEERISRLISSACDESAGEQMRATKEQPSKELKPIEPTKDTPPLLPLKPVPVRSVETTSTGTGGPPATIPAPPSSVPLFPSLKKSPRTSSEPSAPPFSSASPPSPPPAPPAPKSLEDEHEIPPFSQDRVSLMESIRNQDVILRTTKTPAKTPIPHLRTLTQDQKMDVYAKLQLSISQRRRAMYPSLADDENDDDDDEDDASDEDESSDDDFDV
eukprot:TRINITY_DN43921_c0_g1_i1.p1 TRINITY_DN43921_c0_g1~~TRINITY_DN43921_c0_g1_i1.p1  ORF type:complete len:427 (-),score=140.15 TRINITY_DN43921_c0_g1_i1:117-1397(-)